MIELVSKKKAWRKRSRSMNYMDIIPNIDVMSIPSSASLRASISEGCEVRESPHPALVSRHGLCSDSVHESQALPPVGVRGGVVNLLVTERTSTSSSPFLTAHQHFLAKLVSLAEDLFLKKKALFNSVEFKDLCPFILAPWFRERECSLD